MSVSVIMKTSNQEQRYQIYDHEKSLFFGNKLRSSLTAKETEVDEFIKKEKIEELTSAYKNSERFLPSIHFFQAKDMIEKSKVFAIITRTPKGASLHTHMGAAVSADFIINNISYRDNLYGCFVDGIFKLKFLSNVAQDERCKWRSIKEMRQNQTSAGVFDQWLKTKLMLNVDNPKQTYPYVELIWAKFKNIFSVTYDLFSYKPVFQDYVYEILQEIYDDNIIYTELKGTILSLYELNGTTYSKKEFFEIFIETVEKFKTQHARFQGVRYIHSISRCVDKEALQTALNEIIELKKCFPDFIVGIDFVGYEEEGKLLAEFETELLEAQKYLKFFFHAGETNWFGHTDLNLTDAILFNSFRIGHGFAITKHPVLLKMAKDRNLPLELCPISNQVLMLNDDPRNHPATYLLATDYPLVICNDDPSIWNAKGLSYDWYVAFMAMTSKTSGIEVLKQFAVNSILYSACNDVEKKNMMEEWTKQWKEFLDEILTTKNAT